MELHELLPAVMDGELSPDQAAEIFRQRYLSRCREHGIDPNTYKPFDQQERRLIMGVPVEYKDGA